MPIIFHFQPLKCVDIMLFFVIRYFELNFFGFLDCWSDFFFFKQFEDVTLGSRKLVSDIEETK